MTTADLVVKGLVTAEAELIDEARELASDSAVLRELAHVAVHELARLTKERDQARATILHLREELRRYTQGVAMGRGV